MSVKHNINATVWNESRHEQRDKMAAKSKREYLLSFMETLDFPDEAKQAFLSIDSLFNDHPEYSIKIRTIMDKFNTQLKEDSSNTFLDELNLLALDMNISSYTIHLLFYMYCSQELMNRYEAAGISLDIFWNSMLDLRCKLYECFSVYGIWGTFTEGWAIGFFKMKRFGLGRLQYERVAFPYEKYIKREFTVQKGDIVYNTHIPSSGPLTKDRRIDSYKRAYEFFKEELEGKPLTVVCHSWLLYPDNEKFFPIQSNIIDFMHDFDIIDVKVSDNPAPSWRVFGKDYKKPLDELPGNTSLQRAYIDWFRKGNKTGNGYGILLFDGKDIL